jgi:ABC-2 type transport system ATP-binding protein
MIVGLVGSDAGRIDRASRVGYCPQQPLLWDKLTVAEHFALFATAYGMSEEQGGVAAASMLDELQFVRYAGYRVERLSGGTRQKLNLALALMHDPQLLVLDEPYSGFDWETYLHFWEMSRRRRDEGMGILIVSHLLAERERLDRVYELRDGKTQLL